MLLSVQQKYILETLRKLGCVRSDQLHALVRGKFQRPGFAVREEHMTTMLRQLRSGLGAFHVGGSCAPGWVTSVWTAALSTWLGVSPTPPDWRPSTSCWS